MLDSIPSWPVISSYTRADALQDGVLVEVPADLCREAGIVVPVATTSGVWNLVDPGNLETMPGQSITGRTWDLLWMFRIAARASRHQSVIMFKCLFLMHGPRSDGVIQTSRKTITFRAVCGPGDRAEPVITIMLPGED